MKSYQLTAARLAALMAALLAATAARAQGGIPPGLRLQPNGAPKPSAALPAALPATTPTAPPPLPQQQQPASTTTISTVRRARVDYSNGLLTVTANNSSLNQILGSIARATGIKITGGVTDERVYGTYGPASISSILTTLLDGTGSNMMLSGDNPGDPQVLTLTPRQAGGPTPPSPPVSDAADDPPPPQDLPPQLTPRNANDRVGPPRTENPPQPNAFTPPTTQPDGSVTTAAPTSAAATTTDQSPNGVKTPQQIYDQLMKLQSQQPKAPQ